MLVDNVETTKYLIFPKKFPSEKIEKYSVIPQTSDFAGNETKNKFSRLKTQKTLTITDVNVSRYYDILAEMPFVLIGNNISNNVLLNS